VTLTPFSDQLPPALQHPAAAEGCAVDRIGDHAASEVSAVARAEQTRLVGWAADAATKTVPPVVVVELAGAKHFFAPAVRATPRPDVAEAMKAPSLLAAGWDLLADFSAVPPGKYDIHILQVSAAAFASVCDPKRQIELK